MQELLRINLTTQLAVHGAVTTDREVLVEQMRNGQTVNVDGYDMALPFYEQVSAVKLATMPHGYAGPCLIVQVERNQAAPPARDLVALEQRYARATLRLVRRNRSGKRSSGSTRRRATLSATTLAWIESASRDARSPSRTRQAKRCSASSTSRARADRRRHRAAVARRQEPRRAASLVQQDGRPLRTAEPQRAPFRFRRPGGFRGAGAGTAPAGPLSRDPAGTVCEDTLAAIEWMRTHAGTSSA